MIQEIVVDDFIPLNNAGVPLFCQPTVRETTSEFWTLILEKALAKVKGSYANIMGIFINMQRAPRAKSSEQSPTAQQSLWSSMKRSKTKFGISWSIVRGTATPSAPQPKIPSLNTPDSYHNIPIPSYFYRDQGGCS